MTTDDYLALITSEHAKRPNYLAVVAALTAGLVDNSNLLDELGTKHFDLDQAIGVQLDAVGLWVGITRRLRIPLPNVYFTWNDTVPTGWNAGIWKGRFDPVTGLTSLPDDVFRILIRAKIAANHWDGTIPGAAAAWEIIFNGEQSVIIQDNQDMTMVLGFVGPPLSAVEQALLTGGYIPLKPAGVGISYYAIPAEDGPLFGFDADTDTIKGWDEGGWAQELPPS